MKRTVLSILALLLVLPAFISCNGRKGDELTVMSYNVRNAKANDGDNSWDLRKPATAAMLDKVNPDIFGVQEAYPNQVEFITENCPRYKSFGVGREDGVNEAEHNTEIGVSKTRPRFSYILDSQRVPKTGTCDSRIW